MGHLIPGVGRGGIGGFAAQIGSVVRGLGIQVEGSRATGSVLTFIVVPERHGVIGIGLHRDGILL